jgi:hypothetical protein
MSVFSLEMLSGRYGRCANGLMCSNCNRCQGCSFQVQDKVCPSVLDGQMERSFTLPLQTFICWDDKDCIW